MTRALLRSAALAAGRARAVQHRLPALRFLEREATRLALVRELGIDLVLDVGANEGQFARDVRRGWPGPIVSFEPVEATWRALAAASARDPLWHAERVALGREPGVASINVSTSSVFSSLLAPNPWCVDAFGPQSAAARTERVRVERLDALLPALPGGADACAIFLKMDTQGFDLEVFEGAAGVLDRVAMVQSEVSLVPLYEGMPGWHESIARFEAAGFAVAGMFPVVVHGRRVVEYDCLLCR